MGQPIADFANELFASDSYRDYLEVHGIGVQLTEALAEYWHRRVREELKFPDHVMAAEDPDSVEEYFKLGYRGARFSFGYGACPNLDDRAKMMELLEPGPDRCDAVRGATASPGAVHRRVRPASSRGEVLQHLGQRNISALRAAHCATDWAGAPVSSVTRSLACLRMIDGVVDLVEIPGRVRAKGLLQCRFGFGPVALLEGDVTPSPTPICSAIRARVSASGPVIG